MVIKKYNRNRKTNFENSVSGKSNITLNFHTLDIPCSNIVIGENFKMIFPVPYPITYIHIHNTDEC